MVGAAGFVEQVVNGLSIGMVYVLIAAGLSVIFGVMDVINFAHGELYALGAYFAFALVGSLGGGSGAFWIALVVAPLAVGVVGAAIERVTLRPLYDRNPLYHILLTFGLVLMFNDAITFLWGRQPKAFAPPPMLDGPVTLFGITNSLYGYFIVAVGAVLSLATWWALNETRFGLVVRAGAQDREMVRNLGVDIDRYYTLVFGAGAALAAVAGIVLGAYREVSPAMGNEVIIPAFVIVVLGGLGSFRGAVVGGLLVGVVQTLTRTYFPVFEGLIVFGLMILVLLVRPEGLFGTAEGGSGEAEELLAGRRGGVLTDRQRGLAGTGLVALLALVPFGVEVFYSPYALTLLSDVLVWALFALSLDFVMGYAGLVSLGHALFYGTGAYAAVLAVMHVSPSIFVALAVAVAVCAVVAWVVGYLSIRVSGVYFAMITLAFAQLFYRAVFKLEWAGGSDGLFGADVVYGIGSFAVELDELAESIPLLGEDALFYYLLLGFVVGSYLLARRIMAAPFGSVLQSIREGERRTEFVGYDVTAYKRRAFVVSGAMAGLAGGLFAVRDGYVAPSLLHWLNSGEVVVMTVLGGMGTLYGPMLGAGVYIGFEDVLSSYTEQWQFWLGLLFVLFVIFLPRGLVSLPGRLADLGGGRTGAGGTGPGASGTDPGASGGQRPAASARPGAGNRDDDSEPLADGEVNE